MSQAHTPEPVFPVLIQKMTAAKVEERNNQGTGVQVPGSTPEEQGRCAEVLAAGDLSTPHMQLLFRARRPSVSVFWFLAVAITLQVKPSVNALMSGFHE